MTTRALTMLNESGDTTIVWEEDRDDEMIEIIRKKMAEGITFFTIEPRFLGILPPRKTKITDAEQAREKRAVAIPDEDFRRFVESGSGDAVKTSSERVTDAKIERFLRRDAFRVATDLYAAETAPVYREAVAVRLAGRRAPLLFREWPECE